MSIRRDFARDLARKKSNPASHLEAALTGARRERCARFRSLLSNRSRSVHAFHASNIYRIKFAHTLCLPMLCLVLKSPTSAVKCATLAERHFRPHG
jgi:hypothetical protein